MTSSAYHVPGSCASQEQWALLEPRMQSLIPIPSEKEGEFFGKRVELKSDTLFDLANEWQIFLSRIIIAHQCMKNVRIRNSSFRKMGWKKFSKRLSWMYTNTIGRKAEVVSNHSALPNMRKPDILCLQLWLKYTSMKCRKKKKSTVL